ncbi:hypothetical protein VU01_11167 [Candidatus Electrothrix marina]|uniref:IrrE N-terminal-like domain-containing protein n=1 Tax=Candidatus Electrothrix marina TaxID=1859130 RepID=A0A444JET5_9BACT|nr:hypothetical protein VU01_11167 [Candidatus Electrothrix marina]
MLSYNNKADLVTKINDSIFVSFFGKKHLTDTLFHEIGHLVYEKKSHKVKKNESETFAEEYALNLYYKAYPLQKHLGNLTNIIYKSLYSSRIEHDNQKRISYNQSLQ